MTHDNAKPKSEQDPRKIWQSGFRAGLAMAAQTLREHAEHHAPVVKLTMLELAEIIWHTEATQFNAGPQKTPRKTK